KSEAGIQTIAPLAPTALLGQWPLVSFCFSRFIEGCTTLPSLLGWLISGGILILYGVFALALGFRQRFLSPPQLPQIPTIMILKVWGGSLIMPAWIEELLFRCLLIPHPQEGVAGLTLFLWATFSLSLFLIYHPIKRALFLRQGTPLF
ncbi:MAG: CPBP family intramembrane metalloprotease domain-containing protein, partial [Acaryochloridaceae cyanobacterium SU_2_1]|nr:CPBP family intramembrane metalloprotease domain-containing protein [Acaryochloridaceae cyanobacterium SU_2_1]